MLPALIGNPPIDHWESEGSLPRGILPTGHAMLDQSLPAGGWPSSTLSEVLIDTCGVGELRLMWPALADLTARGERVALVAPPYRIYPPIWIRAGIDSSRLLLVQANEHNAAWAAEQCLRSGSFGAVICWPRQANDRALRRLQAAAEAGSAFAFAYRLIHEAVNPSPAALRLVIESSPLQLRVLKCRGALHKTRPLPASAWS
ncbi:translesion DNA synthesis-associated protein ImuA [Stutzerimonas urumqiensis]|uniref:translesion DNA synthesis-associated protein ImuA n=1 Tax=Stutzerimonas urumqiensis TaxID=638269 RepID=UPI003BAAE3E6